MEKWREDAQPEWPEAASVTRNLPVTGGEARPFPETGRTDARVPVQRTAETDIQSATAGTAALRDPWDESGRRHAEATHDPHEVTVQLDAVQLGDVRLRPVKGGPGGGPDGSDGPVFVDESGRRSRRFRRFGIVVGLACAVYAVVIVVTLLSGSSDAPWLPVPDQQDEQPAGQVDTSPLPAESAKPSGTGSASPGASATAGDGATPSAGATASGAAGTGQPGASADPKPSATKSTSGAVSGGASSGPSPSTGTGTGSSPDPTPTDTAGTGSPPDPSPSTGGGDSAGVGTNTVADGAGESAPVAESPATEPDTASPVSSPSPEYIL